jgi:hypothetical protein
VPKTVTVELEKCVNSFSFFLAYKECSFLIETSLKNISRNMLEFRAQLCIPSAYNVLIPRDEEGDGRYIVTDFSMRRRQNAWLGM